MATDAQRGWNNSLRNSTPPMHALPKLTPAQIDDVRRRLGDGETPVALALEYGVSAGRIRDLR
jgi:hypothetical protein